MAKPIANPNRKTCATCASWRPPVRTTFRGWCLRSHQTKGPARTMGEYRCKSWWRHPGPPVPPPPRDVDAGMWLLRAMAARIIELEQQVSTLEAKP